MKGGYHLVVIPEFYRIFQCLLFPAEYSVAKQFGFENTAICINPYIPTMGMFGVDPADTGITHLFCFFFSHNVTIYI
jgi:hypothetical protein